MIGQHFVWDAHACLPLLDDTNVNALEAHREAGVDYVSINVGMDFNPVADILRFISHFRNRIEANPNFMFANKFDDIDRANRQGKLAVSFDLEGACMLQEKPEMVATFHQLGVRQIHLAYNRNNLVSGGCHDHPMPLTELGKEVISAISDVGMIMDCSHMGEQTTMDVMSIHNGPVCFSHTNVQDIFNHGRCVSQKQIRACAKTGGVIGISGVNRFHGTDDVSEQHMADQIDHIVQSVGVDHVGIGLDYMYPAERDEGPVDLDRSYWWPSSAGYFTGLADIQVFHPNRLRYLLDELLARGYSNNDCTKIFGGNFARVAQQVWQP